MRRSSTALLTACAVIGTSLVGVAGVRAVAATGPEVVISELMIDPADVFDSRGEWVELSNVGDQPANLEGWTFTDERREHVVLPDLSIEPGGFVVVTRTADPFVNGGAEPDWVYGNGIVLYNPSDRLILSNADGVEQDRVDWYPGSGLAVPNGRSLARRPSTMHPGASAQWCASTTIMVRGDLGSPGATNNCDGSATPLVISEVMQNPRRSSDDMGEFFEVHNPGTTAIDMAGWTVKDDDDDRFTVDSSTVVPAGGFAVLGTSATDNGRAPLDYVYGDAMRLFNDTDELVIADTAGILVDRVAWDDGQTFPDPDGASMSLLDPAADNAVGSNWCTSTTPWAGGDLGTPGSDTWCGPVADQTIVVTEIMFDPELPPHERASEWFEVTNVGTTPVDLAGWTLTAGEWKVHTIDALVVEPGAFAVLAASGDPVANGSVEADYVYGGDLPLFNRTGRIIVRDAVGAIVDRVDWSAANGFPLPSGHSIALGDPTSDDALGANWCVSSSRWADGDFGTPGSMGDCEAPPASPALRIVEIMRNPFVVRDSVGEWLEIENPTDHDVDLDGWALGDDDSDHHVIRDAVMVPANGSIVLGRSTDPSVNGGAPVAYSYGDAIVLGNRADEIVLADPHGRTVDAVRWDSGSEWIRPNGASMALLDGAWCVSGPQFGSGDLGTPGAPNDCTELAHDDVVISEVHIDPAAVSDTIGEWIELTNASASPIDIEGWKLRDDDADRHTIRTGAPWVIAPGESVVLGRERSSSLNGGAPVDYEYGTDFPITNHADEIVLVDDAGVWVDRVAWASGRRLPASSGVSASLRSLDADNALPSNWCPSVTPYGPDGEFGSPGAPNLCDVPESTTTTSTTTTVPAPSSTTSSSSSTSSSTSTTSSTTTSTTTSTTSSTTTTTGPPSTSSSTSPTTSPTTGQPSTSTTTSTTLAGPVGSGGSPWTAGFGILAVGPCFDGLTVTGSSIEVGGGIRSNTDITVQGSKHEITGPVSYGRNADVGSFIDPRKVVKDPTPVAGTLPWTFDSLRARATAVHVGTWQIGQAAIAPGVHVVFGDVNVSGAANDLSGVTIVATGSINISGSLTMSPAGPSLPTIYTTAGGCSTTAIHVSGSSITWSGLIAAPNGTVRVNASKLRAGTVLGAAVHISGSDLEFG